MENTGYKRSLIITVTKEKEGLMLIGYPKIYNGLLSFGDYQEISDAELQELPEGDFNFRLAAFKVYVESLEPGIKFIDNTVEGFTEIIYDPSACPIPQTTTTTTTTSTTTTTTTTTQHSAILNINVNFGGQSALNNGLDGIVTVCGNDFETNKRFTDLLYINTTIQDDVLCELNFTQLISEINSVQIEDFRYWRFSGETDWNEFTLDNYFSIINNTHADIIDIDILISDVSLTPVTTIPEGCHSFILSCDEEYYSTTFQVTICDVELPVILTVLSFQPIMVCASQVTELEGHGLVSLFSNNCTVPTTTTTTSTTTTTTTTTEAPATYWYMLFNCNDQLTYYVGPYEGEMEFSIGERVEGNTSALYIVIGTTNSMPETTIGGIVATGQLGCPA